MMRRTWFSVLAAAIAAVALSPVPMAQAGDQSADTADWTWKKPRPCEWTGEYTTGSARLDSLLASKNPDFWGTSKRKVVTTMQVNPDGVWEDVARVVCAPRGYKPPTPVKPR